MAEKREWEGRLEKFSITRFPKGIRGPEYLHERAPKVNQSDTVLQTELTDEASMRKAEKLAAELRKNPRKPIDFKSFTPSQKRHFNQKLNGTRKRARRGKKPQNCGSGASAENYEHPRPSREMQNVGAPFKAPAPAPPKNMSGASRPRQTDFKRPGLKAADKLIERENHQMGEEKRKEKAEKVARDWERKTEEQRKIEEDRRVKEAEERRMQRKRKELEKELMYAVKEKRAKEAALEEAKAKEGEKMALLSAMDEKLGFTFRPRSPARYSPLPRIHAPPPSVAGSNSSRSSTFSVDTGDRAPSRLPRRRETPPPASSHGLAIDHRPSRSNEKSVDLRGRIPERYEESRMRFDDRLQQKSADRSKVATKGQKKLSR